LSVMDMRSAYDENSYFWFYVNEFEWMAHALVRHAPSSKKKENELVHRFLQRSSGH